MREWIVQFAPEFSSEFDAFDVDVQDELVAHLAVLAQEGPKLGRPLADTLKGSKYANMKELRFSCRREVWRFAFAFDPLRHAVVLLGGNKAGRDQKRFYEFLLREADRRFAAHLARIGIKAGK